MKREVRLLEERVKPLSVPQKPGKEKERMIEEA